MTEAHPNKPQSCTTRLRAMADSEGAAPPSRCPLIDSTTSVPTVGRRTTATSRSATSKYEQYAATAGVVAPSRRSTAPGTSRRVADADEADKSTTTSDPLERISAAWNATSLAGSSCKSLASSLTSKRSTKTVVGALARAASPSPGAVNISWFDAVRFCNQLSEVLGLLPCYAIANEKVTWGRDADGFVTWNRDADGFRLPTEAEWEYACRAGAQGRWCFGDVDKKLGEYAWFAENSDVETQRVGKKLPNAWGLHDMHGNVWEWCWDWSGTYSTETQQDPAGPAASGNRVIRGGAFLGAPRILRSAFRSWFRPGVRNGGLGFRCVRVPSR